ncbi:methyltransferase [Shewanella colwelliana]|uniref:methyltransferase n=1 Tax=Shewanella colwelliana TaxID=23 RepID=UPI00048DB2C9|nr:methyltransferase [Shewanella colwelliana]
MSYSEQFQRIDGLLMASRALWQVKAFECIDLPWRAAFPELARQVWAIEDDLLDDIDADPQQLMVHLLPALQRDLTATRQCWPLDMLTAKKPQQHDVDELLVPGLSAAEQPHFSAHIKGRKWQQIVSFCNGLKHSNTEVLEWCAGKGHLGRLIAKAQHRAVTSIEWQQTLCDKGTAFAKQWQLPQRFVCADAFSPQSGALLKVDQQAVALHACGDLHVALLQHAANVGTKSVVISPCCYHLIRAKTYQPLSQQAKASQLTLSKHDLQLPLQHSTIANDKARSLRLQEVAWRLGFDALQRDVTQSGCYLPIPAIKQSQLSGSFEQFCQWAAAQKQLVLPPTWSASHYQTIGLTRQRLTRRIDLVAHLFRAHLERWLILDRCCFMQESGYQVSLSEFCAPHISPRNTLISATCLNSERNGAVE